MAIQQAIKRKLNGHKYLVGHQKGPPTDIIKALVSIWEIPKTTLVSKLRERRKNKKGLMRTHFQKTGNVESRSSVGERKEKAGNGLLWPLEV